LGALGRRCVIACEPRLVALFAQAALGASVMPLDTARAATEVRAQWLPLMSVPAWHRTRPETVPSPAGYLVAESARVARWRARLPATGLRVALAWAGNPRMETGRHMGRSPPLAALEPLLRVPAVRFISLQKGPGEEQLDAAPFGRALLRFADLDAGPDAFLDTAAVLKCVDLLVTSDTAIAHLAGALGVPTWVCLMHEPDWRWMRGGGGTPGTPRCGCFASARRATGRASTLKPPPHSRYALRVLPSIRRRSEPTNSPQSLNILGSRNVGR
jgi:hypothetical protein